MSFYDDNDYDKAKELLQGKYAKAYKKIEAYIRSINSNIKIQEGCLILILDELLCAQKDNKQLAKVTGPNLRKYCNSVLSAEKDLYGIKYISWLFDLSKYLLGITAFTIIFFIFCYHRINNEDLQQIPIENIFIISILIFAFTLALNRIIPVILFKYAALSRALTIIILFIFLGFAKSWAKLINTIIPWHFSFPISYTILFISSGVSLLTALLCWIYIKRNRVKRQELPELGAESELIICPNCGKEIGRNNAECPNCRPYSQR